jgi:type IV pilus assembly protein PilM
MSVGLDIGSKTIKIVELVKEANLVRLQGSGIIGYSGTPPETLENDKDFSSLAQVIRKLHSEARISRKEVVVSLPEPLVFTRTVKFPLLTDAEVASAVKWEAEQYIPIPVNEAILQHQILEKKETATPPEVLVLLVAAPRTLIEKYLKVVSLAGLNVIAAETQLMALCRALAPQKKTVMIVDFGAKSTNIAISKNTQLVFSRSVATAGEAFTRAISQNLTMEAKQAEEYKKAYGLSVSQQEGKVGQALRPIFAIVAEEIKKAIHFYQTEEKGEPPSAVVLAGGTSGMPGIVPALSGLLGMEVIIGNPFTKVVVDPSVAKALLSYQPLYSVAVGLGLREEES